MRTDAIGRVALLAVLAEDPRAVIASATGYRVVLGQVGTMDVQKIIAAIETAARREQIIGPEYSATLDAIYKAAKLTGRPEKPCASLPLDMDFYLYSTTIPVEKSENGLCFPFHRLIATDDVLARRIGAELSHRHIRPTKAIPGSRPPIIILRSSANGIPATRGTSRASSPTLWNPRPKTKLGFIH